MQKLIQSFSERLNDDKIPLTFVALKENKPIGCISLKERPRHDFFDFPSNSIWMGSLQIILEERRQGIGYELLKLSTAIAKRLDYKDLYFYTSNPSNVEWYIKRGAHIIKERLFRNHMMTIMHISLQ